MNVYIRNLATALAETGIDVDIFTRATDSLRPPSSTPPRGSACNVAAGPLRKVPKEELPELAHAMVVQTDRIRLRQPHRHYDRHPADCQHRRRGRRAGVPLRRGPDRRRRRRRGGVTGLLVDGHAEIG